VNFRQLRPGLIVAALAVVVAGICLTAATNGTGDPMLEVEIFGGAVLAIWAFIGLRKVLVGRSLAAALEDRSSPGALAGVACRIVNGGGRHAFVLGAIRPQIYIGDELVAALDEDELRAVLIHEEHHLRTLAPLRATALEAWLALVGWVALVRAVLLDRLVDLEQEADAHALRRGVDPSALASALVKADPSVASGASFAAASARRLKTLVAVADGAQPADDARLPYEWLPVAVIAIVALACHTSDLAPF
jgi:Zn-dependent protease with chaperone function